MVARGLTQGTGWNEQIPPREREKARAENGNYILHKCEHVCVCGHAYMCVQRTEQRGIVNGLYLCDLSVCVCVGVSLSILESALHAHLPSQRAD